MHATVCKFSLIHDTGAPFENMHTGMNEDTTLVSDWTGYMECILVHVGTVGTAHQAVQLRKTLSVNITLPDKMY